MKTYTVTTTGADLTNNYFSTTGAWDFFAHGAGGAEVWEFTTEQPAAAEALLDTDPSVISYTSK